MSKTSDGNIGRMLRVISYLPLLAAFILFVGIASSLPQPFALFSLYFYSVIGGGPVAFLFGPVVALVAVVLSFTLMYRKKGEAKETNRTVIYESGKNKTKSVLVKRERIATQGVRFEGQIAEALGNLGLQFSTNVKAVVNLKSRDARKRESHYEFDIVVYAGDKIVPIEVKTRQIEPSDIAAVTIKCQDWSAIVSNVVRPVIITSSRISKTSEFVASKYGVRLIGDGNIQDLADYIMSQAVVPDVIGTRIKRFRGHEIS